MASWDGIRENLLRSSSSLAFHRGFAGIRQLSNQIAPFSDPTALLDALHRRSGSADYKNELLGHIVRVAQTDDKLSDIALTLMLLALWPGLDAIRRRSMRREIGASDEIVSGLLARATDAIRRVDLSQVNWIAATILKNIERDTIRASIHANRSQNDIVQIDPDEMADEASVSQSMGGHESFFGDMVRIIGADAMLVIRVVIYGLTQAEAAIELGVSETAARKRYQRAVKRLRKTLEKNG